MEIMSVKREEAVDCARELLLCDKSRDGKCLRLTTLILRCLVDWRS